MNVLASLAKLGQRKFGVLALTVGVAASGGMVYTASGAASGRIGTMERALTGPSVAVLCPVDDPVPVAPVRGCGYRVPRRDPGREAPYGR